MTFAKGPFTPAMNDGNHVFVFGSNLAGRHGAGAALEAKRHWGAVLGVGAGMTGRSYALPTKDEKLDVMRLCDIRYCVGFLLRRAADCRGTTFLVTAIGTGLAGYRHEDIAPMFKDAPDNCVLPKEWEPIITQINDAEDRKALAEVSKPLGVIPRIWHLTDAAAERLKKPL